MGRAHLALALLVGFAGGGVPAQADEPGEPVIYKWVDENGIAHYTTDPDRIPGSLRGRLRELERKREPQALPGEAPSGETWALRDLAPEAPPPPSPVEAGPPEAGPQELALPEDPGLATRIQALEQEIARDEERLQALISDPERAGDALADDPEFREVARRLPRRQADLRALREQQARQPGSASPPRP